MTAELPELAPYARTTTRLHPRRGEPGVFHSSIGGRPLWPADEPWPIRPSSHFGPYDEEHVPAVLLLQLYRRDVAQLPFPEGTDLLQVLWYPIPHETFGEWHPEAMLFWRDSTGVTEVLTEIPVVNSDYPEYAPFPEYVPTPCLLHPEPGVVEYPSGSSDLLQSWDWGRLEEFEATSGQDPFSTLFVAPGVQGGRVAQLLPGAGLAGLSELPCTDGAPTDPAHGRMGLSEVGTLDTAGRRTLPERIPQRRAVRKPARRPVSLGNRPWRRLHQPFPLPDVPRHAARPVV